MKRMPFRAAAGAAMLSTLFVSPLLSQTRFNKYVALGDTLTAGVEGNCLVTRHQQRSYPKLVADALGISDFQQPLVSERALGAAGATGTCLGAVVAGGTITVGPVSSQGVPTNATLPRPYDNLGMPGANAADLVDLRVSNPTGNTANRSAALVLRNFPGGPFQGRNAVEEANLLSPDLVSVWIGPNDVLGAAVVGAAIDGVTLTPAAVFETKYSQIMSGLQATGRRLITLNVPDVTALAFVRTIPPVVVDPTTRQPVLVNGNPIPLLGPRTTPTCSTPPCPIPSDTLVTLGASPLLGQGIGIPTSLGGTGLPLPDGSFSPPSTLNAGVLLYSDEVALIRQRTTDINGRIASVASANGATVIDAHVFFDDIVAHGYDAGGGIVITTAFLTGGLFSADGFHPTNIGYAIVAKEIVQHLNETADAGLELPDLAHALFEPDVPQITTTGVLDPAAGPFGFSSAMWRNLLASEMSAGYEIELPAPAKRVKFGLVR
jgi:GDSL-like Lipase/Acylhydrolase